MAQTTTELQRGTITEIYIGTDLGTPATSMGYTRRGSFRFNPAQSEEQIQTDQGIDPVLDLITDRNPSMTFEIMQLTQANLLQCLPGLTESGYVLSAATDPNSVDNWVSISALTYDENGATRIIRMRHARPSSPQEFSPSPAAIQGWAVQFVGRHSSTVPAYEILSAQTLTATLATGVLTRVANQGIHLVIGEGAAADALTQITGTGCAVGEQILLKAATPGTAITVTDGVTMALNGDVDVVLTKAADYVRLQCTNVATPGAEVWTEVARYIEV